MTIFYVQQKRHETILLMPSTNEIIAPSKTTISPCPLAQHPWRAHLDVRARADRQEHDRQERVEIEEGRHEAERNERERARERE